MGGLDDDLEGEQMFVVQDLKNVPFRYSDIRKPEKSL